MKKVYDPDPKSKIKEVKDMEKMMKVIESKNSKVNKKLARKQAKSVIKPKF